MKSFALKWYCVPIYFLTMTTKDQDMNTINYNSNNWIRSSIWQKICKIHMYTGILDFEMYSTFRKIPDFKMQTQAYICRFLRTALMHLCTVVLKKSHLVQINKKYNVCWHKLIIMAVDVYQSTLTGITTTYLQPNS